MVDKVAQRRLQSIEDLRPASYNPRTISDAAAGGLRHSIEDFGDISGIVWNQRTGNLVAGHQRVEQLRKLGAELIDGKLVVSVRGDLPEFPVRVVDWPLGKEKAANVAANNPHVAGSFTPDLAPLLDEIRADIGEDDFVALTLDKLLRDAPKALTPVTEDEVPEPPADPVTRPGDVWLMGEHRLVCGDSTDPSVVARALAGRRAEMMNTDPPYGVDYAAVKNGIPRIGFKDIQARGGDIANDDLTDGPALQAFLERMIRAWVPSMVERPAFYFWHPMLTQGTFFAAAAAAAADILIHRQIVWRKPHMVLTRSGMYHWQHELCFYGWIRGKQCPWYGNKSQTSVWELGESQQGRQHPTQKPVALFARPMENHTRPGGVVCEPFAGSGSQFVAAEQLGRVCCGAELEPKYCDVVVERWENLTGGKAKRESA